MALTELPVEHLFTMQLSLARPVVAADGPQGTRVTVAVLGGIVTGGRVNGTVLPGGADWVTVRTNGVARLDVRTLIETDDGAVIVIEYQGIYDAPAGAGPRTAPLFQTGDERYRWLNDVQAIGIGTTGKDEVTYEVYALR